MLTETYPRDLAEALEDAIARITLGDKCIAVVAHAKGMDYTPTDELQRDLREVARVLRIDYPHTATRTWSRATKARLVQEGKTG